MQHMSPQHCDDEKKYYTKYTKLFHNRSKGAVSKNSNLNYTSKVNEINDDDMMQVETK